MPKYKVTVTFTSQNEKVLDIFAKDEEAAEEKAVDIIEGWSNTSDVSVDSVEEV